MIYYIILEIIGIMSLGSEFLGKIKASTVLSTRKGKDRLIYLLNGLIVF